MYMPQLSRAGLEKGHTWVAHSHHPAWRHVAIFMTFTQPMTPPGRGLSSKLGGIGWNGRATAACAAAGVCDAACDVRCDPPRTVPAAARLTRASRPASPHCHPVCRVQEGSAAAAIGSGTGAASAAISGPGEPAAAPPCPARWPRCLVSAAVAATSPYYLV